MADTDEELGEDGTPNTLTPDTWKNAEPAPDVVDDGEYDVDVAEETPDD